MKFIKTPKDIRETIDDLEAYLHSDNKKAYNAFIKVIEYIEQLEAKIENNKTIR